MKDWCLFENKQTHQKVSESYETFGKHMNILKSTIKRENVLKAYKQCRKLENIAKAFKSCKKLREV